MPTFDQAVERAKDEAISMKPGPAKDVFIADLLRAVFACPTCKGDMVARKAHQERWEMPEGVCPACGGSGIEREWRCEAVDGVRAREQKAQAAWCYFTESENHLPACGYVSVIEWPTAGEGAAGSQP